MRSFVVQKDIQVWVKMTHVICVALFTLVLESRDCILRIGWMILKAIEDMWNKH